jgi:hypothetical protein
VIIVSIVKLGIFYLTPTPVPSPSRSSFGEAFSTAPEGDEVLNKKADPYGVSSKYSIYASKDVPLL